VLGEEKSPAQLLFALFNAFTPLRAEDWVSPVL
jgi:hypothetical protein